jgi:ATP phosphoribosyltransferase
LRIATKYHRLIREYLQQNGVADYQLVDSQGATEGTVKNETAEAVADITSTGETLRANHLRLLDDGPALKSQATLLRSKKAVMSDVERADLAALLKQLELT